MEKYLIRISFFMAMASFVAAFSWGPRVMVWAAATGAAASLAGAIKSWSETRWDSKKNVFYIGFGLNLLFLLVAGVLYSLFLRPLPEQKTQLPKFSYRYRDPDGRFELKGPASWTYKQYMTPYESGVIMTPYGPENYMGVSELRVVVKLLDKKPASKKEFLKTLAGTLAPPHPKKNVMFSHHTERAELLDKSEGIWSILEINRFWVPMCQISLMGIKKDDRLCSVSAAGLRNHNTLSRVMCLGVFQSLSFPSSTQKTKQSSTKE